MTFSLLFSCAQKEASVIQICFLSPSLPANSHHGRHIVFLFLRGMEFFISDIFSSLFLCTKRSICHSNLFSLPANSHHGRHIVFLFLRGMECDIFSLFLCTKRSICHSNVFSLPFSPCQFSPWWAHTCRFIDICSYTRVSVL